MWERVYLAFYDAVGLYKNKVEQLLNIINHFCDKRQGGKMPFANSIDVFQITLIIKSVVTYRISAAVGLEPIKDVTEGA